MRKFCFAFIFALVICVGSCFAFSTNDCPDLSPYSFSSHSVGGRLVDTAASVYASAGWTSTDHEWLNQIRLALTQSSSGTILGYLDSILSKSHNIWSKLVDVDIKLGDIKRSTDYLQNINNNTNSVVSLLSSDLKGSDILSVLNNAHLDNIPRLASIDSQLAWWLPRFHQWLTADFNELDNNVPTLFHYVKNLSETLASDDDKALAQSQANNRKQVEQEFLSGSSGNTSLGASDFGDLSSVGGSVKDSISLNGQSSISGFTDGLNDANNAGQGWFSAETRDALDSVSSSSSYSLKRQTGNSDIYNMAGFSDHYSWLYGE